MVLGISGGLLEIYLHSEAFLGGQKKGLQKSRRSMQQCVWATIYLSEVVIGSEKDYSIKCPLEVRSNSQAFYRSHWVPKMSDHLPSVRFF